MWDGHSASVDASAHVTDNSLQQGTPVSSGHSLIAGSSVEPRREEIASSAAVQEGACLAERLLQFFAKSYRIAGRMSADVVIEVGEDRPSLPNPASEPHRPVVQRVIVVAAAVRVRDRETGHTRRDRPRAALWRIQACREDSTRPRAEPEARRLRRYTSWRREIRSRGADAPEGLRETRRVVPHRQLHRGGSW